MSEMSTPAEPTARRHGAPWPRWVWLVVALAVVGAGVAVGIRLMGASTPTPTAGTSPQPTPESTPTPDGAAATESDEARTVPTTDQLAEALLTPAALGEGWELFQDVGTGEIRGPGNFCYDSQDEYGDWYAETGMFYGRHLEQEHWLTLGQQLTSGEPEQMQALFDELAAAMEACHGAEWDTIEEGHLRSELMDVPSVGEAGVGLFFHSDGFEASDGVTVVADGQQAVVLDGPVLMFITLGEFREPSRDPAGAEVDFNTILQTAAQRLPG